MLINTYSYIHSYNLHTYVGRCFQVLGSLRLSNIFTIRLKSIMLLNSPIILSGNSF